MTAVLIAGLELESWGGVGEALVKRFLAADEAGSLWEAREEQSWLRA